ncbi:MAG: hypothetical protein ACFHU9_14360 [Fluviicola sp.]
MRYFLVVFLLSLGVMAKAQDSIVSLDVLSAPQSPAANLMGFTDSEILKPESPTDFMTNIKTASDGFSTVPNSLGMDFRLKNFWKLQVNNSFQDYTRLMKKDSSGIDICNNIQQTAILSFGYKNYAALNDSLLTGQGIGIGFKFSVFRGKRVSDDFEKAYDKLNSLQEEIGRYGREIQAGRQDSSEFFRLDSLQDVAIQAGDRQLAKKYEDSLQVWDNKWAERVNELNAKKKEGKADYTDLKEAASALEFKTYGFVWDVAGGAVLNFPTQNFDYSVAGNSGAWTTFGWEYKTGLSILFLGRVLYTPDVTYTNRTDFIETGDIWNYDGGGRILYEHPGKSFSFSAEGIYRGTFNGAYDSKYRFTFNAGYEIYRNMKLTFMFGRDYDGNISREGTVISALQLLAGFGSKKNLNH